MKQFLKALPTDGDCSKYIILAFTGLSIEKIKAGVFYGPQIRQLIRDEHFTGNMSDLEKNAWLSFKDFLGDTRASIYTEAVQKRLDRYRALGCSLSIEVHFLHSHLANFPENLRDVNDEQGKRSHQDFKAMEQRYQGRWDVNMMADYCWSIERGNHQVEHSRKSYKRTFLP